MTTMRYFDANCCLGRFNAWDGTTPITAEGLLAAMDHHGIHEALVVASLAREQHPVDGNKQLQQLIAGCERLLPAWVALPPATREMPASQDFLAEMQERGVRALFLYPMHYRFSLGSWADDSWLAPFAERRVPVFISPNGLVGDPASDMTDWAGVNRVCHAYPDLPVIVSETRVNRNQRLLFQALDSCPNLRVDLSSLWFDHAVEFICRNWGADRLLFGTGLPTRNPAAARGQLDCAAITPDDRAAVAGNNLRQLLSWAGPLPEPAVTFPEPVDSLHALALSNASLAGQHFACGHGHLGRFYASYVPDNPASAIVAELDRLGFDLAVLFANAGMNGDEAYGNDLVAAAVRQYPGRLLGLTMVNLNRSPEEMHREMERGLAIGLSGLKLHPHLQGYDTLGPNVDLACAFADEHGCIIVNHDWGPSERLLDLCLRFPRACFITGHTSESAIPVIRKVDNLYVGSCPLHTFGSAERWVQAVGAERIVFGSDLTWNPIGWGLGPVLYARIPESDKRLILGGNLRRLLEKYGRGQR